MRVGAFSLAGVLLLACKSEEEPRLLEECATYVSTYEHCGTTLQGDPAARARQVKATRATLTLKPNASETERETLRAKCLSANTQLQDICK